MELRALLSACPLENLTRIDVGLEGDWSPTVTTIWTRDGGRLGFSEVVRQHECNRPSLELYFVGGWIGLHCFRRVGDANVFDESAVEQVIDEVEAALPRRT